MSTGFFLVYEKENCGMELMECMTQMQGKIITSAGVASGIDMALELVAVLTDEVTAKATQLHIEYDPQPPFNSGHPSKATPEVLEKESSMMDVDRAKLAAKTQGE